MRTLLKVCRRHLLSIVDSATISGVDYDGIHQKSVAGCENAKQSNIRTMTHTIPAGISALPLAPKVLEYPRVTKPVRLKA